MHLQQVQHVDHAISSLHSLGVFLNKAVDMQIMRDILTVVSRAPSESNTQPWKGYVIMGKKYDETLRRGLQSPN